MSNGFNAAPDTTVAGGTASPPAGAAEGRRTGEGAAPHRAPVGFQLDATIEVALTAPEPGYVSTNVSQARLKRTEAVAQRVLWKSLLAQEATLADGTRVVHQADAIRWLLGELGKQLPIEAFDDER